MAKPHTLVVKPLNTKPWPDTSWRLPHTCRIRGGEELGIGRGKPAIRSKRGHANSEALVIAVMDVKWLQLGVAGVAGVTKVEMPTQHMPLSKTDVVDRGCQRHTL